MCDLSSQLAALNETSDPRNSVRGFEILDLQISGKVKVENSKTLFRFSLAEVGH
jgi:hypothetical protein